MLHVQSLPQKVAGGGSLPAKSKTKSAQDATTSISNSHSASATARPGSLFSFWSLPQKEAGGGSVPDKNKTKHAQDAATSISTNTSASATTRPATDTVDTRTVHGKTKRKYIDESDEQGGVWHRDLLKKLKMGRNICLLNGGERCWQKFAEVCLMVVNGARALTFPEFLTEARKRLALSLLLRCLA